MNIDTFRTTFPEFNDASQYPTAMIMFWSAVAEMTLSADRWGEMYDHGMSLFVAHHIAIAASNKSASTSGGTPGQSLGVVQSKSVGSVSVSYDTSSSTEMNAGHWNQTIYGRQYIRLARTLWPVLYQL
jgi:hypothetical protein